VGVSAEMVWGDWTLLFEYQEVEATVQVELYAGYDIDAEDLLK
jgi:hypothetical protein